MNVYPRMIEDCLYQHPALSEVAVVGEPHRLHGEIPIAYAACKPGQSVRADTLTSLCKVHLGRHEIPRKIVFMDQLPKSATGKILKRQLRRHGELERGIDTGEPGT